MPQVSRRIEPKLRQLRLPTRVGSINVFDADEIQSLIHISIMLQSQQVQTCRAHAKTQRGDAVTATSCEENVCSVPRSLIWRFAKDDTTIVDHERGEDGDDYDLKYHHRPIRPRRFLPLDDRTIACPTYDRATCPKF